MHKPMRKGSGEKRKVLALLTLSQLHFHWLFRKFKKSWRMKGGGDGGDVKRSARQIRYKAPSQSSQVSPGEDLTPDYMNILGMIFSMGGLLLRLKWCAWVALYCSCISFANSRVNDDTKQIFSSFMLSISAVVMSYIQNPQPMSPPWASTFSA